MRKQYVHNDSGKIYTVINHAINCTSDREGSLMFVYISESEPGVVFVREFSEFEKMFSLV